MKNLLNKLKQIKHWELYVALIAVAIILGLYFSTLTPKKNTANVTAGTETTNVAVGNAYADKLAAKLQNVLSSIAGAGKVSVLVMTDGEGTAELAYDTQEKTVTQTGANGQAITTTTKDQALLTNNGSPVILWTNPPALVGIVVVATGASNVSVRLNILRAVQTIIGDKNVAIEILNGN